MDGFCRVGVPLYAIAQRWPIMGSWMFVPFWPRMEIGRLSLTLIKKSFSGAWNDLMSIDPFEQFERSRSGLLIPVAVFVVGLALTVAAVRSLHVVSVRESAEMNASEHESGREDANTLAGQKSENESSDSDPQSAPEETPSP